MTELERELLWNNVEVNLKLVVATMELAKISQQELKETVTDCLEAIRE